MNKEIEDLLDARLKPIFEEAMKKGARVSNELGTKYFKSETLIQRLVTALMLKRICETAIQETIDLTKETQDERMVKVMEAVIEVVNKNLEIVTVKKDDKNR